GGAIFRYRNVLPGGVECMKSVCIGQCSAAPLVMRLLETRCQLAVSGARFNLLLIGRLEEQRRPLKHIEHKHHRADEENEELHRYLCGRSEDQTQAALRDGAAGQIALHLALVGAKVGEREK